MTPEDTVMSGEQMSEEIQKKTKKWSICNPAFIEDVAGIVATRQAEISFPKGEKQGIDKGRKEVVGWIENNGYRKIAPNCKNVMLRYFDEDDWQAFLKKLGL